MKFFVKILFVCVLSVFLSKAALASCDDKRYTCSSGEVVDIGQCYHGVFKGCGNCSGYEKDKHRKCDPTDYSNWMTTNVSNQSLMNITVPGAHDAVMSHTYDCTIVTGDVNAKTQRFSTLHMLRQGIRYFDVRPVFLGDDEAIHAGHFQNDIKIPDESFIPDAFVGKTIGNFGCKGHKVNTVIDDVKTFLDDSDTGSNEIVILNFSHLYHYKYVEKSGVHVYGTLDDDKDTDYETLHNYIKNNIEEKHRVLGKSDFLSKPLSELAADGPKVIFIFSAEGYDGADGIYSKKYLNAGGGGYSSPDKYSSFAKVRDNQFSHLDNAEKENYFTLHWYVGQPKMDTVASYFGRYPSLFALSIKPNSNLSLVTEHVIDSKKDVNKSTNFPNVLMGNNVDYNFTSEAIKINNLRD